MGASTGVSWELPVGDPVRRAIGRAVLGSMLVAIVFVAFTWTTKELPALYVHVPWRDDPYDTFVSFAIFFIPLITGLCVLRVPLCRRDAPLPLRRALDLLRASRMLVAVVLVTLVSEWASVIVHADRGTSTSTTTVLICILGFLTAFTVAAARELRRARREPLWRADTPSQPDWLADAVALGERGASRVGSRRDGLLWALRWLDRQLVARMRCHPLRAAAVLALVFGVAVTSTQAIAESYAPSTALLFLAVAACGMFAFLVIVGAHLCLVGPRSDSPSRAIHALALGCASVPLTLAFRSSLWWILGTSDRDAGLAELTVLLLVVAIATGTLVLVGEPLVPGRRK